LNWEIIVKILLGGATVGGIAYLLGEYCSRRDFDWSCDEHAG
jgi:hypothetical protein